MRSAKQIGDELEDAVAWIESIILKEEHGLKEGEFFLTPKYKVNVGNVLHEIDIFIEIKRPKSYSTIFVFECKNRTNKSDKNDIIIFAEKINTVKANKGFFISRGVTKDARNQARNHGRIEIVDVSAQFDVPDIIRDYHICESIRQNLCIKLKGILRNSAPTSFNINDLIAQNFCVYGEDKKLIDYLVEIADKHVESVMNKEKTDQLADGEYPYQQTKNISFTPSGCRLSNWRNIVYFDVLDVIMTMDWMVTIRRPKIVWKYDVKDRGRIIRMMSDKSEQLPALEHTFVQISENKWAIHVSMKPQ